MQSGGTQTDGFTILILLIYGLFNNVVSNSDYIMNDMAISELERM
jgi:hypothetical protein